MLREWRHEFARLLRERGIAANATERAVRGETRTHKTDGIYRATLRGDSTHTRDRVELVAAEILRRNFRVEPGNSKLIETRKAVERGWRAISAILATQGHHELAADIHWFLSQMLHPQTERERIASALRVTQRKLQLLSVPPPAR